MRTEKSEKIQENVKKQEMNEYYGYRKGNLLPTNHIDDSINLNSKGEKVKIMNIVIINVLHVLLWVPLNFHYLH